MGNNRKIEVETVLTTGNRFEDQQVAARNYYETFIQVAADCPVSEAVVPSSTRPQRTIPQIEYDLLVRHPYEYMQEEFLFAVHTQRLGLSKEEVASQREVLWKQFFIKSRACLRTSVLPKKFGWGFHFDAKGRVALVAMESELYEELSSGKGKVTVLRAIQNQAKTPYSMSPNGGG